ncbi:MAG: DUF4878 domain-containing protein [Chitinophagaceae bacterium]|jgi:hypothetical protein|nr:DUF4878 domain-containing protein [Chitinophagaceae bacterium]
MKKNLLLFTAFIFSATLIFIACKGGGSSSGDPKATAEAFFEAMNKKDFTAAKKYATKESQSFLDMIAGAATMAKDSSDVNKGKITVSNVKIDGDNATVSVENSEDAHALTVHLKKEDGAWKVAFDKNAITNMATDALKEGGGDLQKEMNEALDSLKH